MELRSLLSEFSQATDSFTGRNGTVDTENLHAATEWPNPVGLTLGILSVIIGQALVILYFYAITGPLRTYFNLTPIQKAGPQQYVFSEALQTHLAEPGGFLLMGGYLIGSWMFNLMPLSYYSFQGGINLKHVLAQLIIVDFFQTFAHLAEHKAHPYMYRLSHKPHHKFINPRWADAFNGSTPDTICMILVPLFLTANIVHCNVWSYMAFGTIYSSYLTLIHSEYSHPWDPYFRKLGIATAADHHVHHRCFVFNFGHLFTYWDRMLGTYRNPLDVSQFRKDIFGAEATKSQ